MKISIEETKIKEIAIRIDLATAQELCEKLGKSKKSNKLNDLYASLESFIYEMDESDFALEA